MILTLKAKHFKGTDYLSNCNCALSKAAKEQFKTQDVNETVNKLRVDDKLYRHRDYRTEEFNRDLKKAKSLRYSNAVLKNILIKEII